MSKAKWGVHCQLNDANYLERIFTASQISVEISGNIHPDILVSQLISLAAQQAGQKQVLPRGTGYTVQATALWLLLLEDSGIVEIYDVGCILGK